MSVLVQSGSGLPLQFARLLMDWQRLHGRSGLPWQGTRDPYRVWLSEVMLQQTQVSTVLAYFPRFLERFPTVQALASASADQVMALWAGLGYYSRARNLHRCAQAVVAEHGGVFPNSASVLQTLPGIGASTAAAIAAFCHGERVSIVDGNVRRVLSRLLAFDGDLAKTAPQRELWTLAQAMLPVEPLPDDMTAYTQGLMDLGATLCLRSRPQCERCPVQAICRAHESNTVLNYPVKTRTLKRRHESWWLLLLRESAAVGGGRIWLVQRPSPGIWAGLYCPPVFDSEAALIGALPAPWRKSLRELEPVAHSLTHRELRLHPLLLVVDAAGAEPLGMEGAWIADEALHLYGLPAPVRVLLRPWLQSQQP
ncbi:MAG: A/G-specific adenine glycosylase [Hydrogenophaga sp.]|uniref:A/G-specific adenine glycosylase n=1 Tax=Hydrogenophaga sp. TaxID=1904254 RepID=UPI00274BFE03|nr:A/G-specific adenine glycosylase [Hydrogenophaga sp.]MDP2419335.1 A/G-specific adenine glycosylase [Hydrogenophaga sp.]MDZ4189338.1 A/G-specific adenine glycosylase [Hydrogenophaga sp.]